VQVGPVIPVNIARELQLAAAETALGMIVQGLDVGSVPRV